MSTPVATRSLLRMATAGSVDDGKSTLVGRLLYDSKAILADQLAAVERVSQDRGLADVDLALLTDGLRAEREQGITIDVAYRHFSTPRRHTYIAHLLGTPLVVLVVNKMDLVGDNVAARSDHMSWCTGPSLLEHLETVPLPAPRTSGPARFPVQYVIWAPPPFRGYAGQVASGLLRVGDPVVALPSGRQSRVSSITTTNGDLGEAAPRTAVALRLQDELDIGRGEASHRVAAHPRHPGVDGPAPARTRPRVPDQAHCAAGLRRR